MQNTGDQFTTLTKLKDSVTNFCAAREWDQFHTPKDLVIGLLTEAAELAEEFRFKTEAQIKESLADPTCRADIGAELADCLFFLLRMSERFNFDLTEQFELKMKRNAERYPVEKAKGTNVKYDKLS